MANKKRSPLQPDLLPAESASPPPTAEEQAEKERYRQRLREFLQDPASRQIPGFPIGEDEAILALSDPPYYTACPNPFLPEILERWIQERAGIRQELGLSEADGHAYRREPFAADVSEGKNDPIYNAHSYHTKVPHKAILRYLLHYTDPGDVVLDGFCGTGMTGLAAQLCGDKQMIESLGYQVQKDGSVLDEAGRTISRLGARKAVLIDLSPAATFIAYNYNTPIDARAFKREAHHILKQVQDECGWMYETWHPNCGDQNRVKGRINFTVWSDVFRCPLCGAEMSLWDAAYDKDKDFISDIWDCPKCSAKLSKNARKAKDTNQVERAYETVYDSFLGTTSQRIKQLPIQINYTIDNQRYRKKPDKEDLLLIDETNSRGTNYYVPIDPMLFKGDHWGDTWRAGYHSGITHVHHFYTRRNLITLSTAVSLATGTRTLFAISALFRTLSKMFRWAPGGKHTAGTSGTLYIPSISHEYPILDALERRIDILDSLINLSDNLNEKNFVITTNSSIQLPVNKSCIDYIFVDPPFGDNLIYSELNFLSEAWLKVFTKPDTESIVSESQKKSLTDYRELMHRCFSAFFDLLKPGRWMTVEFHNSQNAIWNAIQEAVLQAGFIVADVRTLDKQQGTFKQINSASAVKHDLVISAYKPTVSFEQTFKTQAGTNDGVWSFIRQHLTQLPIPSVNDNVVEMLGERQPYLLYDRMVAFHLVRGLNIPLSSGEFYQGLSQRYLERDGMYFIPSHAAEYDKRRLQAERVAQLALFVTDEKSAVQWLRQALDPALGGQPATYADLQPRFIQQLHQARHEALPELQTMLEQNFLPDSQGRWYAPDPDRQADLEALRQRSLLREFHEYRKSKGRLRTFRSEAVRAGFSQAWKERKYEEILEVAERLPEAVLLEDPALKMYYDNALSRAAKKPKQEKLL